MSRRIAIALLSTALACASSRSAERGEPVERAPKEGAPTYGAAPSPGGSAPSAGMMCPTEVPGTEVATADTPDGEAVTFTTSGDVSELRRRVRALADMHNQHQSMRMRSAESGTGMGAPAQGYGTSEGTAERGGPESTMSSAAAEDVDGGARILYSLRGQGNLEQLRNDVRASATDMQRQGCGMMQPSAPSMPSSPGY